MKGKWMVSTNNIGGEKVYQVYRLYDVQEIDHSGNREVYQTFDRKSEAVGCADMLNQEEENE